MLALDPRNLIGHASTKFGGNDFSIDDPRRHLNPFVGHFGFGAVTMRSASPSFTGSPSTATCLRREAMPERIRTLALGTPSAFAMRAVTARLASPPSAIARTRTLS